MLRAAASRLGTSWVRSIATTAARLEGEAAPAGVKEFQEAWGKTAPSTLGLPELPTNFLAPEASGEAAVDGDRFKVNFYTPHGMVAETKVRDLCQITAANAAVARSSANWQQTVAVGAADRCRRALCWCSCTLALEAVCLDSLAPAMKQQ
jgi:hypothetical protein